MIKIHTILKEALQNQLVFKCIVANLINTLFTACRPVTSNDNKIYAFP